ncbi:MAG: SDR family oxidoreductase [Chloroflexota bacterium]|nr:SDR family oxidoreductase [Chloroflexota bacterium]
MTLVVGATGRLGGQIAHRLLADGRNVRVLVRPQSDYESLVQAGAEPIVGDLKDPASLRSACEGIEAVITTANAIGRGGDDTLQTVDDEGNQNLIHAAVQAGVERFIFTSVLGSDPSSPAPVLHAKGATEERLRASGMTFTITQADVHMDTWIPLVVDLPLSQGESVRLVGEGRRKHSFVAQQDVAAFTVAALDHPAAKNSTIVIGGPEPLSWRDIVAAVERELGRPIRLETIPVGQRLPGIPDFVTDIMTALEMYDTPLDMRETASTYGVAPTPLATWVHERFAGAAAEARRA